MTAVAISGVWKYYGDYPALRDITLRVEPGACLALLGRNGAGKTTLLKILAGLSTAAKGRVEVFGDTPRTQAARARTGVLGHGIGIYDELSAIENLKLFARFYGIADSDKVATEWLDRTGLLRVRDGLVREFSRGMRQRLAVARAFLHRPGLMLLDEPFTALDDRGIAVLQECLNEARRDGATVILSTHQLKEAFELASDVALIDRGRLMWTGPRTEEMLDDPAYVYRVHG